MSWKWVVVVLTVAFPLLGRAPSSDAEVFRNYCLIGSPPLNQQFELVLTPTTAPFWRIEGFASGPTRIVRGTLLQTSEFQATYRFQIGAARMGDGTFVGHNFVSGELDLNRGAGPARCQSFVAGSLECGAFTDIQFSFCPPDLCKLIPAACTTTGPGGGLKPPQPCETQPSGCPRPEAQ